MLLDSAIDNSHESILDNLELAERLDVVVRGMFTLTPSEYKVMYALLSGVSLTEYAIAAHKTRRGCDILYRSALKKLQLYVEQERKDRDL